MTYEEMASFGENVLKSNVVPRIEHGYIKSLDGLQSIADNLKLASGEWAEGIVVRPLEYPSSGIGRPLGFKIINRNYRD